LLLQGQSSRLISSTPRWNFPQARSTHCSSAQSGFPGLGGIIAMNPLPDSVPALLADSESPLPLGDFYIPFWIAAFDSACRSKAQLYELPDSPSLPVSFMVLNNQPSDHRSRLATPHQIRLFREPLGTLVIMLPKPDCVKGNLIY
jgi:hypothetical protein